MTPAEQVLAWLGSAGALVQAIVLDDGWTSVEGWAEPINFSRHVAVLVPDEGVLPRCPVPVRDDEEDGRLAVHALGEQGVRYLGRWLVEGGRLDSPHVEVSHLDEEAE